MARTSLIELLEQAPPTLTPEPWPGAKGLVAAPDGLPARVVKLHNSDKAKCIAVYSNIFATSMRRKWRFRCYLDLFCGPGVCWVEETGRFVAGSPLIALSAPAPFTHLVFNDLDPRCTAALERRAAAFNGNVTFFTENANNPVVLNEIRSAIPDRDALSIALLDPQGLDLDLETIAYLSRGRPMDLIINLPVHSLWRECCSHPQVLDRVVGRGWPSQIGAHHTVWKQDLREHFHGGMADLGYPNHEERQVWSTKKKAPLYDFILYSRHSLAIKFFKAAIQPANNQMAFGV